MNDFIKVLGPKLAALSPPVGVLAAEPDTWGNLWRGDNYGNAILNDPTVSALVTVIATHDYGSNTRAPRRGRRRQRARTRPTICGKRRSPTRTAPPSAPGSTSRGGSTRRSPAAA